MFMQSNYVRNFGYVSLSSLLGAAARQRSQTAQPDTAAWPAAWPAAHGQCGQDQQPRKHITREFQRSQPRGGEAERPRGYPGWSRG